MYYSVEKKISVLVLFVFFAFMCVCCELTLASTCCNPEFVSGEILVKLQDDVTLQKASALQQVNQRLNVREVKQIFSKSKPVMIKNVPGKADRMIDLSKVYRIKMDTSVDVLEMVEIYQKTEGVEYAEPNYIARMNAVPDDTYYGQQWGLDDIDAPDAWDISTGNSGIIIAVIDTGIDRDHPDLDAKIWTNSGETPDNDIDDDGNGYIDDTWGWNFASSETDPDDYDFDNPRDDNGHGTHVAGIAAAETNNSQGVAGACPDCGVMSIKAFTADGTGNYSDIAEAITYASENGAQIINMSFSGGAYSATLENALAVAYSTSLLVAAAGNSKCPIGEPSSFSCPPMGLGIPFYPAAFSFVIGVEATEQSGGRPLFSNYDQDGPFYSEYTQNYNYDLGAPGVNIYSTFRGSSYGSMTGTSMASPMVAGVIGLIMDEFPTWSNEQIHGQLLHAASRLNANLALTTTAEPDLVYTEGSETYDDSTGDNDGKVDAGETVYLTIPLKNYWGEATGVTATLSTTDPWVTLNDATSNYGDISALATQDNDSDPFNFSLSGSCPNNHTVEMQVDLTANGGLYTDSFTISFDAERGTELSGVISSNTTLLTDYLYLVTSNVYVDVGVTLTIQPGARLQFNTDAYMRVDGTLMAIGTEQDPIVFTSNDTSPSAGDWAYLRLYGNGNDATYDGGGAYLSGATIQYAILEYAQAGLIIEGCDPYIANNVIRRNMSENRIITCRACGVFIDGGSPYLYKNLVTDNFEGNNGSQVYGAIYIRNDSSARIEGNTVTGTIVETGASAIYSAPNPGLVEIKNNIIMFNQNRSTPDQIAPGLHLEFNSLAQGNLIAHNYCESPSSLSSRYGVGGLSINQNCTALENTIVGNIIDAGGVSYQYGAGVVITHDTALFYENIIYGNKLENGINPVTQIAQHASSDVSAPNNWFGTTVTSEIDDMIWDFYDDPDNYPGKLLYTPIATGPIAAAPPVLVSISLDPTSPVGAETVEFTLTFSKPMDTSVDPLVTFGITDPFTQHQIDGSWTIP